MKRKTQSLGSGTTKLNLLYEIGPWWLWVLWKYSLAFCQCFRFVSYKVLKKSNFSVFAETENWIQSSQFIWKVHCDCFLCVCLCVLKWLQLFSSFFPCFSWHKSFGQMYTPPAVELTSKVLLCFYDMRHILSLRNEYTGAASYFKMQPNCSAILSPEIKQKYILFCYTIHSVHIKIITWVYGIIPRRTAFNI